MSILEKAMELLQTMPKRKPEAVYMYMCFVDAQEDIEKPVVTKGENVNSIIGIAHKYANPDLIPLEKEAFANAIAQKHEIG